LRADIHEVARRQLIANNKKSADGSLAISDNFSSRPIPLLLE